MSIQAFLPAISAAYSLFRGGGRSNAADRERERALREEARAQQLADRNLDQRRDEYARLVAAGYGDPAAAIASIRKSYETGQKLSLGNAARAASVAGYRPGDSTIADATQRISESGLANLSRQEFAAKQAALNDALRLQALLDPRMAMNAGYRTAAGLRQNAAYNDQQGDVSGAVQTLGSIDWDSLFGKKKRPPKAGLYGGPGL